MVADFRAASQTLQHLRRQRTVCATVTAGASGTPDDRVRDVREGRLRGAAIEATISNMCSDWSPSPPPAIADFTAPAEVDAVRAVWVSLDELRLADLDRPTTIGHGLELTGNTRGVLHEWRRGARGEWFGVVSYTVRYADGRPETTWLRRQLVPARALRPRADREPLG